MDKPWQPTIEWSCRECGATLDGKMNCPTGGEGCDKWNADAAEVMERYADWVGWVRKRDHADIKYLERRWIQVPTIDDVSGLDFDPDDVLNAMRTFWLALRDTQFQAERLRAAEAALRAYREAERALRQYELEQRRRGGYPRQKAALEHHRLAEVRLEARKALDAALREGA